MQHTQAARLSEMFFICRADRRQAGSRQDPLSITGTETEQAGRGQAWLITGISPENTGETSTGPAPAGDKEERLYTGLIGDQRKLSANR